MIATSLTVLFRAYMDTHLGKAAQYPYQSRPTSPCRWRAGAPAGEDLPLLVEEVHATQLIKPLDQIVHFVHNVMRTYFLQSGFQSLFSDEVLIIPNIHKGFNLVKILEDPKLLPLKCCDSGQFLPALISIRVSPSNLPYIWKVSASQRKYRIQ